MNLSDDEPSAGTPNLSLFTDTNSSADDNNNNNHNSRKIEITEPQLDNSIPSSKSSATKPSKKRPSGFWTATTSRKGKKKPKTGNGNYSNDVDSNVLLTPAPKLLEDDTADKTICLSKVFKAEGIDLSEDRLTAGSVKGYRMVRATRSVADGAWYFEIKVKYLGESGHVRLGWCMEKADLQGPVGFDGNGYGYRDIDGGKFHKAVREEYGSEGYKEGDVIGFYINLPDGCEYMPKEAQLVPYKGVKFVCQPDGKEDQPKIVPGSEISFFKNGVCQGVAFKDLCGGRYYPAASMYTLPAQPNCEVTFNFGPHFDFFPNDFVGRTVPKPMIEVPYHGFESLVGGGVSVKK